MKRKPRRKGAAGEDISVDDIPCTPSPVKEKENLSPPKHEKNGRLSMTARQHQFNTLLKDFDQNVAMTKKDIHTRLQMVAENLTVPFTTFIIKLPSTVKNMKWCDYLVKMKNGEVQTDLPIIMSASKSLVPTTQSRMETTPALRSSSRLALSKKFPAITPKFDPSTPALNKRLPKPGEVNIDLN